MPERNPGFFTIVTGKEFSSLWGRSGPHDFGNYPAVVKKTPASTLHMEEVRMSTLSIFVGHGYL